MNYKLKHLSKYCCKPANELEFEAVKMAAKLEGVDWYDDNCFPDPSYPQLAFFSHVVVGYDSESSVKDLIEIPVYDFIKKLRMSEEEARELEDDMVVAIYNHNWTHKDDSKLFQAINGHYFKVNEDGKEVYLVREV